MTANLSLREKCLLLAAAAVVATIAYFFLRYQPQQETIAAVESAAQDAAGEAKKTEEELVKTAQSPKAAADVDGLQRELENLKRRYEREQAQLAELRRRWAPLGSSEVLQQLKVEIATLAKESGVHILESLPAKDDGRAQGNVSAKTAVPAGPSVAGPFLPPDLVRDISGARLHEITVESSFHALRRFLAGLEELPWRVTVVRFDIQIVEKKEEQPRQTLKTKMVLAL